MSMNNRSRALRLGAVGDAQLLKDVVAGHLGALGELYDRYAHDVWRAVRRLLADATDVDDVVHATFLALPGIAASYDGRQNCRNWLCGIAVNLALRQKRGQRRFQRMLDAFAHTVSGRSTRDPEHRASGNEELAVLDRAMAALSDKKRAVFLLVELEGLSSEEVGESLDLPAATVRTRLFHARRELKAALEREGLK
jgi:RNA polymerase sigma-70 factor (ECF subfamily)